LEAPSGQGEQGSTEKIFVIEPFDPLRAAGLGTSGPPLPVSVEFGIGHGFTAASDALVLKMILSYDF
jgi:hypothetical protein